MTFSTKLDAEKRLTLQEEKQTLETRLLQVWVKACLCHIIILTWLCYSYPQPEDESTTIRAQDTNYMTYLIMNQLQLHSSWLHVGCMVTIQVSQNAIQKKKEGAHCVVVDHGGIGPTPPRTIPPQAWKLKYLPRKHRTESEPHNQQIFLYHYYSVWKRMAQRALWRSSWHKRNHWSAPGRKYCSRLHYVNKSKQLDFRKKWSNGSVKSFTWLRENYAQLQDISLLSKDCQAPQRKRNMATSYSEKQKSEMRISLYHGRSLIFFDIY